MIVKYDISQPPTTKNQIGDRNRTLHWTDNWIHPTSCWLPFFEDIALLGSISGNSPTQQGSYSRSTLHSSIYDSTRFPFHWAFRHPTQVNDSGPWVFFLADNEIAIFFVRRTGYSINRTRKRFFAYHIMCSKNQNIVHWINLYIAHVLPTTCSTGRPISFLLPGILNPDKSLISSIACPCATLASRKAKWISCLFG